MLFRMFVDGVCSGLLLSRFDLGSKLVQSCGSAKPSTQTRAQKMLLRVFVAVVVGVILCACLCRDCYG